MFQVALIGVSGYGDVHFRNLMRWHRRGELKFSAATVINQKEEAEKCVELRAIGAVIYDDYRKMLECEAGKMDLCCIPTGIAMHAPMAVAAMKAGANVLLEKPAAATIQEIEEMQRVERETGKFVAVAYQDLYRPEFQELKRLLIGKIIGDIRKVQIKAVAPANASYYSRTSWAGRLRHDGRWVLDSPFNNSNAHQINLALFLAGATTKESCRLTAVTAELYQASPIESADTGNIVLETEFFPVFIAMSRADNCKEPPLIRIEGTAGEVNISLEQIVISDGTVIPINRDCELIRDHLLTAVINKCRGGSDLVASLEMVKAHTLCVNGAHESSPIIPVNPAWLSNEGCQTVIRDIRNTLEQVLSTGQMLSEINPEAFHGRGKRICMRHYHEFNLVERKE